MILCEYAAVRPGALEESFKAWYEELPTKVKGWIFERLTAMAQQPAANFRMFVEGPIKEKGVKYAHIYKMRFGGRIEYRPLLCLGPVPPIEPHVVTFLLGAKEVQGRITPSPNVAIERRQAIIDNPHFQRRLQLYEERSGRWLLH